MRKLLLGLAILLSMSFAAFAVVAPTISYQIAHRTADIVIAASNASTWAKASADVVMTGVHDEVPINAAIATLTNGGRVRFTQGNFYIWSPIIIDQDWVTLEGNVLPHWNKYLGAYPTHDIAGTPGGSQIIQTVSGQDGLHIGATSANMHLDSRHHGIRITSLYFLGMNYNGSAIYDTANTDISMIDLNMFQGWSTCINIAWDSPKIIGNQCQDNAGAGFVVSFVYAYISRNLIFDVNGPGMTISSVGATIEGNVIGDISAGDGIQITGSNIVAHGNAINGVPAGSGINCSSGNNAVIADNIIELKGVSTPNTSNNTSGHGIILTSCSYSTVSGNGVFNPTTSNSTGYAINFAGSTTGSLASGNVINPTQLWNGASASANVATVGGNLLINNLGQLPGVLSGLTAPTLTTGACSGSSGSFTVTPGLTAGKFTAAACSSSTYIISGLPASKTGYSCTAQDRTTTADTLTQTADTTTSCTLTGSTAASDIVSVTATAY
jgi:hypothetical protein